MKVFMFHYVKPYSKYYYYDTELFEKTIEYLNSNYEIISLKKYDELKVHNKSVSDKYVMLTFDDGTIDHYDYVYKILKRHNCSGLFFIPSSAFNGNMLDIQIIHQLLEKESINILVDDLKEQLIEKNVDISKFEIDKTLDDNKAAFFKQLLQYKLPREIREELLKYFALKYHVSLNVDDTYIGIKQLKIMKENNMFFGIHTNTHPRLALLSKKEQRKEINGNMDLLIKSGLVEKDLCTIAFPYGSFNEDTLEIMKEEKIKYGFKVNDSGKENDMLINRIDCKYLKEVIYE